MKMYEKVGFRVSVQEKLVMGEKTNNGTVLPAKAAVILVMDYVVSSVSV